MALHPGDLISQFSNSEYIVIANSLATNLIGEIAHLLIKILKAPACRATIIYGDDDHFAYIHYLIKPAEKME